MSFLPSSLPRALLVGVGAYGLVVLGAMLAQDYVLFEGRRSSDRLRPTDMSNDYEQVRINVGRVGDVAGIYRHVSDPRGVALLLLDDRECVASALPTIEGLAGLGLATLCMDYPGYGGSLGKPSADALRAMAHACYLHLVGLRDFDARRIWVIGRTLGSGPACYVAARWPVGGMILLAPFTSLRTLTANQYPWLPVRAILRHEFDNEQEIQNVNVKVLVAWCADDRVIPRAMPERLVQMCRGPATRYVQATGGHDGLRIEPESGLAVAIDEFLRRR